MTRPTKEVYHSSQIQGLSRLEPRESTHGCWLHATRDIALAAAFLGTVGGDFTCAVGRDSKSGKPYICERFEGALDLRYEGVSGSIYVLPGEMFIGGQTPWDEEVVSSVSVAPIRETRIDDAKAYLMVLAEEGALMIKAFSDRIDGIPEDDSDLVQRAVIWHERFGDRILDQVETYHPHLMERVCRAVANHRRNREEDAKR